MTDSPRILIVDDDEFYRMTIQQALEIDERYVLDTATNGREGVNLAKVFKPDIILMDCEMPEVNGLEACRILKADMRTRQIPIIMITGLTGSSDLVAGIDAGADDFLRKPFDVNELLARVRSMLRIKQQYDEIQDVLRMREDFSNMIVHDIRTPLTVIAGMAALVKMKSTDTGSVTTSFLDRIDANVKRVDSMLNDMLVLAKIKDGVFIVNRVEDDLVRILNSVYDNFCDLAESSGFQLVFENRIGSAATISADGNLLMRAVDNLLSNASKFSPDCGTITIRLEAIDAASPAAVPDCRYMISVIDEGPGIPDDKKESVFGKFESFVPQRTSSMSFGLGLALCRLVVDGHDGVIDITDNEPSGAVFRIRL